MSPFVTHPAAPTWHLGTIDGMEPDEVAVNTPTETQSTGAAEGPGDEGLFPITDDDTSGAPSVDEVLAMLDELS